MKHAALIGALSLFTAAVGAAAEGTDTETVSDADAGAQGDGRAAGRSSVTDNRVTTPASSRQDDAAGRGSADAQSSVDRAEPDEAGADEGRTPVAAPVAKDDGSALAGSETSSEEDATAPAEAGGADGEGSSGSSAAARLGGTSADAATSPAPAAPKQIPFEVRQGYRAAVLAYEHEYRKNRLLQSMGKAMLASSFVFELIGTILIEAAPWGPVGWSGFAVVGVGLVHFVTSAFMLGFSKPTHHIPIPKNVYDRSLARAGSEPELIYAF